MQVGVGARRVPQAGHYSPGVQGCTPVGRAIQLCRLKRRTASPAPSVGPGSDLSDHQLSLERIVRREKYTASENVDGAT